ncbi:MAG TPA: bifunctional DNA-formamidopyrimidine glycosylase/DNA-(apurinic or apyrimidinic site) lyase [Pseudonocardia sp.]|jgi:formamidopyrimidine-DNA glycosylase|nr:bifunctional DNA-formamidopyrimidine glycosylase/DNA-(apurinic or apyrimidinic site) lyase [Pseudonocardia sp.]
MPELPEVETVRAGLERFVVGRRIASATVGHDRAVRRHRSGGPDFADRLRGARIEGAARRGKYLWLPLDSGEALLAHLGMSGQLLVQPVGAPDEKHLRIRFAFTDGGGELRFVDQRTFGGMSVEEMVDSGGTPVPLAVVHIARDPLDPAFDPVGFVGALRRRRTQLKRALLDQGLVSGIGNIYADEALWRSRLHYARATDSLRPADVKRLLADVTSVMTAALAAGGTSFDSLYVNVNGASGYFDRSLEAYGRVGRPCSRCGTLLVREPFMNRSSFFCPKCQRAPRPEVGQPGRSGTIDQELSEAHGR